jgi:hypothetical protein
MSPPPNAVYAFACYSSTTIFWLFRTCRGKHTFSRLVLVHHKAMHQKQLTANLAEERGELFQVFLMR